MSKLLPRWVCLGCALFLFGASPLATALASPARSSGSDASHELFQVGRVEGDWHQNSVTSILQTHDGYLWLGTYHGLVRFDGVRFTVFDSSNVPELPNGRVTSLYESPDQVLWIGHETCQLTRMTRGRFQSVALSTNLGGGAIQTITSDARGDLWLVNDLGRLFRLRDGRAIQTPESGWPRMLVTLACTKSGKLWMTANGKIGLLDEGQIKPFAFPGDAPATVYERVFAAGDGGVWVLGGGRLRKWRDGAWAQDVEGIPPTPGAISSLAETRSGLLVGTIHEGLYLLRPGAEPLRFSRTNGLSHDWIRALCVDREGNCWIGTGTGFDGLRPRKVWMLSPPDDWQGFGVLSFNVAADGSVWVGTEGAGLYHYDGNKWSAYGEAAGLKNPFVWSVAETREQGLLVGTWGGGIYRWNKGHFETAEGLGGIAAPVTALYQGRNGGLWVGTQEGLIRYEGGKRVWFAGKDKLSLPDVRTITESPDGAVWFGMAGGGLGCLRGGELKQFGKTDGLGSDLVSCLYADTDGTLWIGTLDNGLTRLANGVFSKISSDQGLPSRVIGHIGDDGVGNLWLSSQAGILRVNKADLRRCADRDVRAVHCLSYGRAEGLALEACTGGFQPGTCRTADGRLWFSTVKGVAVVDPAMVSTNPVPPPIVIETLFVDGVPTNWLNGCEEAAPVSGDSIFNNAVAGSPNTAQTPRLKRAEALRIPPGHQRLEFHYTGLSFMAPDKVRFRRILEGLEQDWLEVGTKRVADYSYLPPGHYTFRVTACNNDDLWNVGAAAVTFTVLPYFYQTLWFRIVSVAIVFCGIIGVVVWLLRRRLRQRLELVERQRAIERERARIARDIHDDLGASLTRISLLSETVRGEIAGPSQVAADVEQIRAIAREATRAMDEIVWAVNPQYDTLDSLVAYLGRYAERFLGVADIRCRLDVPMHLPAWTLRAEIRHNVFLALKEALNNVAKHAKATEVRIALELAPRGFTLSLADNGCGFTLAATGSAALEPRELNRASAGNGLANMRKRMEEIGSTCLWETAPGEGTRINFSVAVRTEA